jgi:curved DNA-binding protein CbpA
MKVLNKNYYNILNVSRTASFSEIKKAYRKLAKEFHPDRNPEVNNSLKIQEINEAYQVLSDPTKRLKLNTSLQNQGPKSFRLVGWEYDLFRAQTFFLADKQFFLNQEVDKGRQETISQLLEILRKDHSNFWIPFNIATGYRQQKDYHVSIQYYSGALKLNPGDAYTHLNLGMVYDALKESDDAISHLTHAAKTFENFEALDLVKQSYKSVEILKNRYGK